MHDQIHDEHTFRILTVSINGIARVWFWRPTTFACPDGVLDRPWTRLPRWPQAITVDNGTEFTSKALDEWAYRCGIKLDYTRPGKLTDNGLIESFNGRLRDAFLNVNAFIAMQEVREKLAAWRHDYNHCWPHGLLSQLTPNEFVTIRSDQLEAVQSVRLQGGASSTRRGTIPLQSPQPQGDRFKSIHRQPKGRVCGCHVDCIIGRPDRCLYLCHGERVVYRKATTYALSAPRNSWHRFVTGRWRAWRDSNPRPTASEAATLSG